LVVTATVSEEKGKPILDERALDKLLEAAYVLQEHNQASQKLAENLQKKRDQIEAQDREAASKAEAKKEYAPPALQKSAVPGDYSATLGKIVETQRQIQIRQLDLHSALALVAERVLEISRADGAAIGFVDGQFMHYRAVAGPKAPAVDSTIPIEKALSTSCLESGQVLRCEDTILGEGVDTKECRSRGIESLIGAPVFLQGSVAGVLELYYGEARAFTDQDVHTSQLMAGLVTEALVRDEEVTWKKSLASERAAMLEALEKLQPNLAALVDKPAGREAKMPSAAGASSLSICSKCGHDLLAEEQFCGECGFPRSGEPQSAKTPVEISPAELRALELISQSDAGPKLPSVPEPVKATQPEFEFHSDELESSPAHVETHDSLVPAPAQEIPGIPSDEEALPDFAELLQAAEEHSVEESAAVEEPAASEPKTLENESAESTALEKQEHPGDWSSAAAAKDFLEKLSPAKGSFAQFWNARRGDIYLAISVILVISVILWGMMSSHSVGASGAQGQAATAHANPPQPNLTLWDRMMIQLGLAEAPAAPEDKGTPGTQVWIDERTGLYYCPGTDLYGKTAKGKFTTQREAQLDQFEPAYRKPCN
jgi:hypothetical protein